MRISDWSSDVCSSDLLTVHRFPAWDCLPYDRAGPSMRISAARLATLSALKAPAKRGELILTTVAAITQRTLTPFRIRQLATPLAAGTGTDRCALAQLLVANGSKRPHPVANQGEVRPEVRRSETGGTS